MPPAFGSSTEPEIIPVYRPDLSGNERRYVLECIDTSWISSIGTFIPRFEQMLAEVMEQWPSILHCIASG
jgi:perosamine synthetase